MFRPTKRRVQNPVVARAPRRCADGLVHFVELHELRYGEPRQWLRLCDPNDDFVKPLSRPTNGPVTCVACLAKECEEGRRDG